MENNIIFTDFFRFNDAGGVTAFSLYNGQDVVNIPYHVFYQDIKKSAAYFIQQNLIREHIAIVAQNSYEWIVTFFGIAASGNTAILLNPDLPEETLRAQCRTADVHFVCCGTAAQAALFSEHKTALLNDISSDFPETEVILPYRNANETLLMMFTSGTTGKSKAVEFSIQGILSYLEDVSAIVSDTDRLLLSVPLHHVLGLLSALSRLYQNQTICIGRGIRYLLLDMPVLNPGIISMVPSILESIVKLLKRATTQEMRNKCIGNNLKAISVGGASANLDLCRYLMSIGISVQSAYGMTETAGAGTWCEWNESNLGSIGKLYGRTECRIQDGELLLRGPSMMKGYYKDPAETELLFRDGWLHTGDMGYCGEDGYYYLTGRKKNVIILSNGENVNPEEIEAKWGACEAIQECMVYSDGKGICADVYTAEPDTAAAFIKAYNEEMPMYRQVYKVNYSATPLEKTGSGKIKRKVNVS